MTECFCVIYLLFTKNASVTLLIQKAGLSSVIPGTKESRNCLQNTLSFQACVFYKPHLTGAIIFSALSGW